VDKYLLLIVAIFLPTLSAILCYTIRKSAIRNIIVVVTTILMFIFAGGLVKLFMEAGGRLEINLEELHLPISIGLVIKIADFMLLGYITFLGFKLKKPLIIILSILQFIPLLVFDVTGHVKEPEVSFIVDYLSLIMVLLVSIIGPIITVFALGYMKEHEEHHPNKVSKQPKFFFVLFIFLAAMNALVLTNDLTWMYFFWEITTLCSFLLISHDNDEISIKNATRALLINMIGGIAFVFAIIAVYKATGTLAVDEIIRSGNSKSLTGLFPIAIGLLCFAGFTKSAQFPFQSWLLGAMVAPTPVSALLHSSTMVKAGVYLVVRLSPAYSGTILSKIIAVVGGFTFLAGSAIAISQRNGKRVLAYSTIANLGLIVCCAGIGSYVALAASVLLIIFHALSKGLLFLCVGTIEHGIGSRDIEDMQGLMKKMPFTTVITVLGMITMLLPPFGVLLTKWLAIEAAVNLPIVLVFIILGSAFTVVFWAKWIGIILTMSYKTKLHMEKLSIYVKSALLFLVTAVMAASIFIVPAYNFLINPYIKSILKGNKVKLIGDNGIWIVNSLKDSIGGFAPMYYFLLLFAIVITIPYFLLKTRPERIKKPYLCGENNEDMRGIEFIGPTDKVENVIVHNYYLQGFFGENNLTLITNFIAGGIILIMFGVVI